MPTIRTILIEVLMFTAIVTGMSYFVIDMAANMGFSISGTTGLDFTTKLEGESTKLVDSINSARVTNTILDLPFMASVAVLSILKFLFVDIANIFFDFLSAVGLYIPLPSWFKIILMDTLGIWVLFKIISNVSKYEV
jgi:hypothetical protein